MRLTTAEDDSRLAGAVDSSAEVDANFVLTDTKKIVEIQATSEKKVLTKSL